MLVKIKVNCIKLKYLIISVPWLCFPIFSFPPKKKKIRAYYS